MCFEKQRNITKKKKIKNKKKSNIKFKFDIILQKNNYIKITLYTLIFFLWFDF